VNVAKRKKAEGESWHQWEGGVGEMGEVFGKWGRRVNTVQ
jgi:hypothetical protein